MAISTGAKRASQAAVLATTSLFEAVEGLCFECSIYRSGLPCPRDAFITHGRHFSQRNVNRLDGRCPILRTQQRM